MSILTPTSELASGHGAPPPGLPDEASLARLASEIFQAAPGGDHVPHAQRQLPISASALGGSGMPVGVPSSLPHGPALSAPPVLGPNAVPLAASTMPPSAPVSLPSAPSAFHAPSEGTLPRIEPQIPAAHNATTLPASSLTPHAHSYTPVVQPQPWHETQPHQGYSDWIQAKSFEHPGQHTVHQLTLNTKPDAHRSEWQQQVGHPYSSPIPASFHQPATQPWAHQGPSSSVGGLDAHAVRRDFPILQERVNGHPLIWLDNAATTHKPQSVIDRVSYFYKHENSNIHRAAHELAARATDAYEGARQKVAQFLGAASTDEIIFVRGATEAINLVARTWGQANIQAGDEIVVSHLEHHANIVPWQMLAAEKGAKLRVIPVDDTGQILLEEARRIINPRTKLVSVTQVSNALGTVTPVQDLVAMAHSVGAVILVDGAQAVSHLRVNMQALDADFYVFSGHKIFGPTGIGVVYAKKSLLDHMPPYQGGGNMIADVTFERTVYQPAPNRFEAGTGNIADAVGLGAALDYVQRLGLDRIAQYEHDLLDYATHGLRQIPGLRLIGTAANKTSVISFVLPGWKTEDIGKALNQEGIAVRSGHHCAQPILRRFGVETTVRPSLAFYNTVEEIDRLVRAVWQLARSRHGTLSSY